MTSMTTLISKRAYDFFIFKYVAMFIFTIRGVGEGVVNDGVKSAGPSGGGHSGESWHQTGKDKELLLSTAVP